MTRIPVRTPHAISSHTKPGDIGHLGIDLEPIPSVHANVDPGPHPASGKAPPQIIAPLASPALFVCGLRPGALSVHPNLEGPRGDLGAVFFLNFFDAGFAIIT